MQRWHTLAVALAWACAAAGYSANTAAQAAGSELPSDVEAAAPAVVSTPASPGLPSTDVPETIGTRASTVDALPKPAPGADERPTAGAEKPAVTTVVNPVVKPAADPAADTGRTANPGASPVRVAPAAARNLGPITRPLVRVGDEWIYRRLSGASSALLRQRVTQVDFDSISLITELTSSLDTTTAVYNREWALLGSGYNTYAPALAYYAFPLYPGKRWRIDSAVSNFGAGQTGRIEGEGVAVGFEEVDTAAGKFIALKVTASFETGDPGDAAYRVKVRETHWYARDVLRTVKVESETQAGNDPPRRETIELVKFKIE